MKRKVKMIGFDLDGTLLTSEKKLTPYTMEILQRAIGQGILVLPATGRPLCGVPKELAEYPGIRYALTANGGRIVSLPSKETIHEELIAPEVARKVLNILEKYDTLREIYYDGQGYAPEEKLKRIAEYLPSAPMAAYVVSTRTPVPDIREMFERENRPVDKIQGLFIRMEDKHAAMEELKAFPEIEVTGALLNNVEVNAGGVNKGTALVRLGASLGIRREEIMAFGDGANDIHMMREAGIGVAMGNAIEEVKAAADYMTATNDEDGAAKFIEKYVLN